MYSLPEDKIKECKVVFDMFDNDKDGKISAKILGDVIRICGGAPSQNEMENIIKGLEKTNNNKIDFEQFLMLLKKKLDTQDSPEDLINEFKKLDKKGNGTISASDLKKLMTNYENALTPQEVNIILEEAKVDGNGYINIEKFVKILMGN